MRSFSWFFVSIRNSLRTTRDQAIIRLGLSLFRNLVAIQDAESSITGSMGQFVSSIMQDTLLERFQEETVMTLLLVLASSSTEPQYVEWNAITLEIFYHIFSGVDPAELIPSVSVSLTFFCYIQAFLTCPMVYSFSDLLLLLLLQPGRYRQHSTSGSIGQGRTREGFYIDCRTQTT